jgi:type II secretory pathway pseudopilin PulG
MLLVVLVFAILAAAALAIAVVSTNAAIAWLCVAASLVGLVLMVFDALRARQRRPELAAEAPVLAYDAHYPDYGLHERPAHDAPIHDDHEVEREIFREEEVLHPDTGPREPDISRLQAFETMDRDHFRGRKGRKQS